MLYSLYNIGLFIINIKLTRAIFIARTVAHIIFVVHIALKTSISNTSVYTFYQFFIRDFNTLNKFPVNKVYKINPKLLQTLFLSSSLHSLELVHSQQFSQSVQGQPPKRKLKIFKQSLKLYFRNFSGTDSNR